MTDTFNIFIQKYFNIFELVPSRDREQGPKPELRIIQYQQESQDSKENKRKNQRIIERIRGVHLKEQEDSWKNKENVKKIRGYLKRIVTRKMFQNH